MTITEALNVIDQALDMGRKAGVYTFGDAALIFNAMGVLSQLKDKEPKCEKPEKDTAGEQQQTSEKK
jgi:hypothetical protein